MANILIAYSTTDGHTRHICEKLLQVVQERHHTVVLSSLDDDFNIDLDQFDKVVIGASIRYGKHRPQVLEFMRRNQSTLQLKPNAFFSVNAVARKSEKGQPENNPYLQKFLKRLSWQPRELAVFAGKIDYPAYSFWDRHIIRFIMWMTNGPTDVNSTFEFTDWKKVEAFGRSIAESN